MKVQNSNSEVHIASPEQCQILLSPTYRALIKNLLQKPHTLSELAISLNTDLNNIYYRIKKLEDSGLVKVASSEKRRGKPIKRYTMSSANYKLPFSNTPGATVEDLIFSQISERQILFRKYFMENLTDKLNSQTEEAYISVSLEKDVLLMNLEAGEVLENDPTVIFWRPIYIEDSRVELLFKDIFEVIQRYTETADIESKSEHLLGIQIIRKPD